MNQPEIRLTTPAIRWLLVISSALLVIVGIPLFVLSAQTDQSFAWTISPPLTAACLGAAYWASCLFVLDSPGAGSGRRRASPC